MLGGQLGPPPPPLPPVLDVEFVLEPLDVLAWLDEALVLDAV
jgi:hypothetical protein